MTQYLLLRNRYLMSFSSKSKHLMLSNKSPLPSLRDILTTCNNNNNSNNHNLKFPHTRERFLYRLRNHHHRTVGLAIFQRIKTIQLFPRVLQIIKVMLHLHRNKLLIHLQVRIGSNISSNHIRFCRKTRRALQEEQQQQLRNLSPCTNQLKISKSFHLAHRRTALIFIMLLAKVDSGKSGKSNIARHASCSL